MFENETKGWHGSYSLAGRSSAEKYHMVIHKDKIVSGRKGKIKIKGFLTQDDDDSNTRIPILQQAIDIFAKTEETDDRSKCNKAEPCERNKVKKTTKEQIRPLYTLMTPSCTKYNPKLDCIWKRALTGPEWEKVSGRSNSKNKTSYNDPGFYLTHCPLKPTGKIFVDMKMQTQRGPFKTTNDVRYRTDVPYSLPKVNKKNNKKPKQKLEKYVLTDVNEKGANITFYDYTAQTTNENSSNYKSAVGETANQIIKNKPKQTKSSSLAILVDSPFQKASIVKCPDFKKTISRAYLNYLQRDKATFAPFFTPNYSLTKPRTLTMVTYDRSVHLKGKGNGKGLREMNIDPSLTFNPDESLKIGGHNKSITSAPNFANMTSRPNNKTPLPFYMQQTCDRNSFYITSAKTLKMNNYSNGKFMSGHDTFWPKKSFNKYINMNFLSSNQFLGSSMNVEKSKDINDQPTQAMKFYRKNFDDQTNEYCLRNFDAVTLRSIPKKHNISINERQRFEINFNYN